jgi:hypothetical protein
MRSEIRMTILFWVAYTDSDFLPMLDSNRLGPGILRVSGRLRFFCAFGDVAGSIHGFAWLVGTVVLGAEGDVYD